MPEALPVDSAITRFLNADNEIIAFLMVIIIILCMAIRTLYSDNKETSKAMNKLSEVISVLVESVRNVKGK